MGILPLKYGSPPDPWGVLGPRYRQWELVFLAKLWSRECSSELPPEKLPTTRFVETRDNRSTRPANLPRRRFLAGRDSLSSSLRWSSLGYLCPGRTTGRRLVPRLGFPVTLNDSGTRTVGVNPLRPPSHPQSGRPQRETPRNRPRADHAWSARPLRGDLGVPDVD